MEEKEATIHVLERKLMREKRARQAAEQQLEEFSLKIYNANEQLKDSLKSAQQSQRELKFLNDMSELVTSDSTIDELLQACIELIATFVDAKYSFYVSVFENTPTLKYFHCDEEKSNGETYYDYIISTTNDTKEASTETWHIHHVEHEEALKDSWLLCTALDVGKNKQALLAVTYAGLEINEEHLFVLDTAKRQLQTGVRRRLDDLRIRRRNKALQESIEHLEVAKKQLIQSEKMASLGQLAAGVAHEINNPIGFVQSNLQSLNEYVQELIQHNRTLETLLSENKLDLKTYRELVKKDDVDFIFEDTEDLLDSNLKGVQRISDIVQGLKTFSHSGADKPLEPIRIADAVEQGLKIVWNSLKYKYDVVNNVENCEFKISGNIGQLQQVFVNLFVNAIHAMPEGGELTIDAEQENEKIQVYVKDNGVGMDDATLSQLFTPFFTTKPEGVGTGLGMSISYGIVESHGGKITASSQKGVGTVFTISFPLIQSKE